MTPRIDIEDMTDAQDEASVTVKPLEWHTDEDMPSIQDADGAGILYRVLRRQNGGGCLRIGGRGPGEEYPTPEEAIAAAQAHYESRILSAIVARPSQAGDESVARLVEAARDVIEGWEWWTADEYDRDRRAVSDGIHDLRAALAAMDTPKGGGDA